jgi:hypothetical protein
VDAKKNDFHRNHFLFSLPLNILLSRLILQKLL